MWRNKETQKKLKKALEDNKYIIVFDTETTGLDASKDQIIQFSGIKFRPEGNKLIEVERFDEYIKPENMVSDLIENLTGITNEFLNQKDSEDIVFPKIKDFLGEYNYLFAYNSNFDIKMTKALYGRQDEVLKYEEEIDVLAMARDLVSKDDVKNHKLGTIAEYYGFDANFHSAIEDASVTAKLLQEFIYDYLEKENSDSDNENIPKPIAKINSVSRWEKVIGKLGYVQRLYVNTNLGTVYFDIKSQGWYEKDHGLLNTIDMVKLEKDVLVYTKCSSLEELRKWGK